MLQCALLDVELVGVGCYFGRRPYINGLFGSPILYCYQRFRVLNVKVHYWVLMEKIFEL